MQMMKVTVSQLKQASTCKYREQMDSHSDIQTDWQWGSDTYVLALPLKWQILQQHYCCAVADVR